MEADVTICVTLVWSPGPRLVHEETLRLPAGYTAREALLTSEFHRRGSALTPSLVLGVWGHRVDGSHRLQDGDRLELYRPLRVDPKVARRARFKAQGAGSAGLFARRRTGAKAGY